MRLARQAGRGAGGAWGARLLGAALFVGGCAWLHPKAASDPVERLLAEGDAAFAQRADRAELEHALSLWGQALELAPNDPRILGRMTAAYASRGYGFPDPSVDDNATAREFGLRCLRTAPAFSGLVTAASGTVTPRAVAELREPHALCVTWTAIAWARWLTARDVAGASIDLSVVVALGEQAVSLTPEDDLAHYALGLGLAIAPTPLEPDRGRALLELAAAIEGAPDRLTPRVDLAIYVLGPSGDSTAWAEMLRSVEQSTALAGAPDLLENQRAIARARAALGEGPPRADAWWRSAALESDEGP